ncbi:hypothetical protein RRG08_062320 [Elysia crispata]|uniref:Uncharacterized protein n=1 Tax=Elysia crispata TaxID=231223 RepID=A0AAE0YGY5_9GAST|nr:hypothetical protein RRG08_062320 [Elysia crispata]
MLCISHAAISSPQHSYNLFCVALFSAPLVNLRTTYRETDLPLLDLDPAVVGLEKVTVYYGVKPTRVTSWSDHLHLPKPLRRSCFNESFKLYLSLSSPFLYRLNLPVTTVLRRRRAPLPTGNGLPVALMMSSVYVRLGDVISCAVSNFPINASRQDCLRLHGEVIEFTPVNFY